MARRPSRCRSDARSSKTSWRGGASRPEEISPGVNRKRKLAAGPPALGELEREVMEIVWARGETSVRAVLDAVNAVSGRERAYTTVMTVMANLARKGLLTRRRDGRLDLYSAGMSRDDYAQARARHGVETLVSEYGDAALASFARELDSLDPERRRALRRLVDDG